MDVILDTNILYAQPRLTSLKYDALFAYLRKTQSHLILPEVVLREAVAHHRRHLEETEQSIREQHKKLENASVAATVKTEVRLDLKRELDEYESLLKKPRSDIETVLLVNSPDQDLPEMIRRLVNRQKPASMKGEGARDILIWLAIKNHLRSRAGTASLISANVKDFDPAALEPELKAFKSKLHFFSSLDDFLSKHAQEIQHIDEAWVEKNFPTHALEDAISSHVENSRNLEKYLERIDESFTGYVQVINNFLELDDFYVSDLEPDAYYLHASFSGEVELEAEFESGSEPSLNLLRRAPHIYVPPSQKDQATIIKYIYPTLTIEFSAKVLEESITDVAFEDWSIS